MIVDPGIVAPPQLAGRTLVKGMDADAEFAGAELATASESELLFQLAERLAKLDLVGLRRILADQPLDMFWVLVHR